MPFKLLNLRIKKNIKCNKNKNVKMKSNEMIVAQIEFMYQSFVIRFPNNSAIMEIFDLVQPRKLLSPMANIGSVLHLGNGAEHITANILYLRFRDHNQR